MKIFKTQAVMILGLIILIQFFWFDSQIWIRNGVTVNPVFAQSVSGKVITPHLSDAFLKASQNIPSNDMNNLDEIYYKVMTLYRFDQTLSRLSLEERANIANRVKAFQNPDGGFGGWDSDRSFIHSTRKAIEILVVLGAKPDNASNVIDFIYRLQITGLSDPYSNGGFKSYLQDSDADISATHEAIQALVLLDAQIPNRGDVVRYLQNHQNPDGGFGYQTHARRGIFWTSTATHTNDGVDSLRLLGAEPLEKEKAIRFLQSLQTGEGGFANDREIDSKAFSGYTYAAVNALAILGAEPTNRDAVISFLEQSQMEEGGFSATILSQEPGLDSTFFAVSALSALEVPLDRYAGAIDYVMAYERNDGGFGAYPGDKSTLELTFDAILALNLIGKDPLHKEAAIAFLNGYRKPDGGFGVGEASDAEATYRAVYALKLLSYPIENQSAIVEFLKSAQNIDGGFGWRKGYTSRGSYTYRAVKALYLLGAEPTRKDKAISFLQSLQNLDGGFGNYIGEGDSDMGSTHRAISALDLLGASPKDLTGAVSFIKESQHQDGGFMRSSHEVYPNNVSFNVFTYDAVRALKILGEEPKNSSAINEYIKDLRNPDFGFGEHSFFTSRVDDTLTALYTLLLINPTIFNTPPILSDCRVEPSEGHANTTFTFYANYTDLDKQMPTTIFLYLNEERFAMEPLNPKDYAVSNGKIYYYATQLPVGLYHYYFEANDGLTTVKTGKQSFLVKYVGNAPVLENGRVKPESGNPDTLFVYSVIYRDLDGDKPEYVRIKLDDSWYDMSSLNEGNYREGVEYVYSAKLKEGVHEFRFRASDGENDILTPVFTGPTVSVETLIRPDEATFSKIRELIRNRFGKEIALDDVWLDVLEGAYVWAVKLDGEIAYITRNGEALITPSSQPTDSKVLIIEMTLILSVAAIAILVSLVIVTRLRRTGHH